MDVTCPTGTCNILLNSKCVFYEGAALATLGINTNDSVQVALQKIDNVIASLETGGGEAIWGSITGTLSNQIDLQAALDAKLSSEDIEGLYWKTSGTTELADTASISIPNNKSLTFGATGFYGDVELSIFTTGIELNHKGATGSNDGGSIAVEVNGILLDTGKSTATVTIKTGVAQYDADYSSLFTEQTLVPKQYVDSNFWKTSGTTTLTDDVTITGKNVTIDVPVFNIFGGSGLSSLYSSGILSIRGVEGMSFDSDGDLSFLSSVTGNGFKFNSKILLYNGDYSAEYTDRAIPDWGNVKSYADSNLLGIPLSEPTSSEDGQSVKWNDTSGAWEYYTPSSGGWPLSGSANITGDVDVSGTKNIKIRSTVASADAGFHLGTNGDVSLYSGSLSTGFSDAIGGVKVWGNTVEIKGSLNLDTSSTNDPALIIPAGDLLTTPTSGSIENDGDHLYYTDSSGTRYQIDQQGGGGGSGTVTSVELSVPTGLTVSGSPITTSGTLAISLDTGYVIPTQATLDGKADLTGDTFTGKVNFTPDATNAGLNVGQISSGPSNAGRGDIWYNTTGNYLEAYINSGVTVIPTLLFTQSGRIPYLTTNARFNSNANFRFDGANNHVLVPGLEIIVGSDGTAGTAPIKIAEGSLMTTPEDGAVEYANDHLYFTIGTTRYQLDQQGGTISDGDKGDITVSSSGTIWTINNSAVTNAKINSVAWSKITSTPTSLSGYGITDELLILPSAPTSGQDGQSVRWDNDTSAWEYFTPGSGTIGGTTGSTDNAIITADGTGGSTIQGSLVTIDNFGAMKIVGPGNAGMYVGLGNIGLHVGIGNNNGNSSDEPLRVYHRNPSPTVGIGVGIQFAVSTTGTNDEIGSIIEAIATDVTGGSEDFDLVLKTMVAGAPPSEHIRMGSNKIGFFGTTPAAKQIVPTGSSTDDVITALQNLGLFSQT